MKKLGMRILLSLLLTLTLTAGAWAAARELIPGGSTVGIKLFADGLMVTGFENNSAARDAGIKKGDLITAVDGQLVRTAEALKSCLAQEQVVVTVLRNGREAEFCVRPRQEQLGAFVRDSISGIGTITYYDPDTGAFGALGHGVNDAKSSTLLPMERGVAVASTVDSVIKGKAGHPGELKGQFDTARILGEVVRNSQQGIFGIMTAPVSGEPVEVAESAAVRPGSATILSNISGTDVRAYTVEIVRVYPHAAETGRNLQLRITDPELLRQTGGIVQGMSGSPIIQNGKLVGAVTHVLVNDPTRGYGIFIEDMLDTAG